jgi:hypothetical protein
MLREAFEAMWQQTYTSAFCTRVTIDEDLSTNEGLEFALNSVEAAHRQGLTILLWGSLPLAGGCTWQRVNVSKNAKARKIVAEHLAIYQTLLKHLVILARAVNDIGG